MGKNLKKVTQSKKPQKSAAANQSSKKTEKKVVAKPAAKPAAAPQKAAANGKTTPRGKESDLKTKKTEKKSKSGKPAAMEDTSADDFDDQLDGEMDEEALLAEDITADDEEEIDDVDLDSDDEDDDEAPAPETASDEIVLTDAEGNRYCRARDCDQIAIVDAYCRYHYLLFWKKIQVRKKILADGKLERYVDELTSRYPDKFLEMIRRDLRTEKDFVAAIQELEIDESGLDNEYEEDTQSFVDEIRGMGGGESEGVEDEF